MNRVLMLTLAATLLAAPLYAADVTQFRGANRDGIYEETGLLKEWPEGGPEKLWVLNGIGAGYSSIALVGDTIYLPGMLADEEGFISLISLDGKLQKQVPYSKETTNKQAPGSRATPTIDGDRLYMLSGLGVVTCFELPSMKQLWQLDAWAKFEGKKTAWRVSESVLIDGEKLICSPGGPDASVVALNKETGETIWTSKGLSDAASYCAADIIVHNGRRILVTETAKLVVGLEPETGKVLWTHPHETDYDIHGVTPLYADGMLYFTGGYKSGGGMLELSEDGTSVTEKWTDKTLDCQHHGVILLDGYLYGTGHGAYNGLICLELATGKVMWKTKDVRQGQTIYAEGMLYVYGDAKRGIVNLVKAQPSGFESTGSFKVTDGDTQHWPHQVIANGHLYVRHGGALIAYDVAAK